MKRFFVVFTIFIYVFTSGCNLENSNGKEQVHKSTAPKIMFDEFISALDNKDSNALKKLFSKNAIVKTPQIDEQIIDLMDFYKGKFVSNEHFGSGSSSAEQHNGIYTYLTICPLLFEVKTDKEVYSLRFNSVAKNDSNTDDEGLWLLMLINENGDKCQIGVWYEGRESKLST